MKTFLVFLILITTNTFAQKPDFPYDEVDFEKAFSALGFHVFKLPVHLTEGTYKIKLSLEYFKDGKSVFKKNLVDSISQKINPVYFRTTEKDTLIRMYIHQMDSGESLEIKIGKSAVTDSIPFTNDFLPYSDWKNVYWSPIEVNKECPILIKYVPKVEEIEGKKFIHQCMPGLIEEDYHSFFSNYIVVKAKYTRE